MRAKPPIGFFNVDLEILSRSKLHTLETSLMDTAHALFSGPIRKGIFLLALECNAYPKDANSAIVRLCTAVARLGKPERRLWDRALSRTFDIGYGFSGGGAAMQVSLRPETLEQVVALGATLAFTCYRDDNSEQAAEPNLHPGS